MKRIKLMADYQSFPLWWASPPLVGNIDPSSLPIDSETIRRLNAWACAFDATLNSEEPLASGFASAEEEVAFEREGLDLWRHLRKQLQGSYELVYFSQHQNREYDDPEQVGDHVHE